MGSSNRSLVSWVLTGHWNPADRPAPPPIVPIEGTAMRLLIGPLLLIGLTPFLALIFWVIVFHHGGSTVDFLTTFSIDRLLRELPRPTLRALAIVAGWFAFQGVLLWFLPGERFPGPVTPLGNTPIYRRNGVLAWVVTHALVGVGVYTGFIDVLAFWRGYGSILAVMNLSALAFCAFLYWKGCHWPSTTDNRRTGRLAFDFFQGIELHPTLFGADIKQFMNCRVSMMGWSVVVALFACVPWKLTGHFTFAAFACAAITVIYLFKFFVWEGGYFHSLDIMHDHFGYYICWGVLSWVPSVYCLAAMYIAQREGDLHPVVAAAIVAFGVLSIYVNWAADEQRQRVRREKGTKPVWGRPPELIRARYVGPDGVERESLLLASGYWGIARHFHYVPELSLALMWSLPAGGAHALPYFYFVFLTILLVDRSRRDDARCRRKYGEYWEEYCRKVPWKILPWVY